jgi:2-polyprenyl-3-methyl-5-hydroxy-6-metoxy-1,4-benzoquinol methylase
MQRDTTTSAGDRERADREHFDRIASSYTRKDESASSRVARRFRLESTVDSAGIGSGADYLEVGCGAGYAVEYLGGRVGSYVGIDHSAELVALATRRHASSRVTFRTGRVQDTDLDACFDCVFVIGVLHHLEGVEDALVRMVMALRPGGWLVVNEPQPNNPIAHLARRVRKRIDSTYSEDQVEFTPTELRVMFGSAGLVEVETRPQGFLSTPFAEVPLPVPALSVPIASAAVQVDRWLARRGFGASLSWNCIAVGRRP